MATNFGQGLLQGLRGATQFNQGQQQARSRAISDEKTMRELESEDNKALAGQMSNMGLLNFQASNKDQILTTDYASLLERSPEVALRLANQIPALNTAELENGSKVGVKAVDYIKNDDGSYSFVMERNDNGKRVPLTQGRSEMGDDVVAKFSAEDLNRAMNEQMVDVLSKGGFSSEFGFMRQAGNLYGHEVKAAAEQAALDEAAKSNQPGAQAMASQLSFLVRNTDDISTLEQIATDMGVDLGAVKQKAADDAAANNASATPNATSGARTANAYEDTSWIDDASPTDRVKSNRLLKDRQRVINSINNKLSDKVREQREARIAQIDAELEVLKEATAADPVGRLTTAERRELNLMRTQRDAAKRNLDAAISNGARADSTIVKKTQASMQEADARIAELQAKMQDKQDSPATSSEPVIPALTKEQLVPLIEEAANNPEKVAQTRQTLARAGVTNLNQLREAVEQNKVPTQAANDAIIAAAVFAAAQPGANADAATFVERFRNQVLRSSQTRTLDAAIDDDREERKLAQTEFSNQTARMNANRLRAAHQRTLRQDGDITQEVLDDQKAVFDALKLVRDGDVDLEESTEVQAAFRRLGSRLKGQPGSPQYESAKKVMPGLIAEYIREVGIAEGAPTIPDWFKDIIRGDSPLSIGDLSRQLVRRRDGVIGIMDPNGSGEVYESPVSIGRLQQLMSVDGAVFTSTLPERQF